MERKTVSFNTDEGPNGRRTTCKGGIEIVKYGKNLDLFIRGPKSGLRHVVMLPDSQALLLGQELMAFYPQAYAPFIIEVAKMIEVLKSINQDSLDALHALNDAGLAGPASLAIVTERARQVIGMAERIIGLT